MPAKGSGVIYLQRDKFEIFTTLTPNILEFHFVPDIVQDMDIINKDLFDNILQIFIQTNKIPPCELIIVPANNVCFISDFTSQKKPQTTAQPQTPAQSPPEDKAATAEIQKDLDHQEELFLEHVPFESVTSKRLALQNGIRVIATNQELFSEIISTFEKQGSSCNSVIPAAFYGANIESLPTLTIQGANFITQATPQLKKYNMFEPEANEPEKIEALSENSETKPDGHTEEKEAPKQKTDKKRLILLSSVFGFLIIILVIVYIASNQPTSPTANAQPVSSTQTLPAQ